jgi:hypothetical protein
MELAMQQAMRPMIAHPAASSMSSVLSAIKTEMAVFDIKGVSGRCLQLAYTYLLSIPPTSVEAERAFSAAGILCTKIRSRQSDMSLDTLCLLRTFYQSNRLSNSK